MGEASFLTIRQVADKAGVSEITVRRYAKRGVVEVFRDKKGQIWLKPDAPAKVRDYLLDHGGPGGRPLRR